MFVCIVSTFKDRNNDDNSGNVVEKCVERATSTSTTTTATVVAERYDFCFPHSYFNGF